MTARGFLSDEAEREEREGRERLRVVDTKLRELRSRRDGLLDQVHQLSDEQKRLYDAREPKQQILETTHEEHRALGRQLSEIRRDRDRARQALEEAVVAARLARQELPRAAGLRPEQLRRELSDLERRQQTTALTLVDENALIDRMREIQRQLAEAEKTGAQVQAQHARVTEKEEAVKAARAEVDRLGAEFERVKVERDRRMDSMRAHLVDAGRLVGEMRERSRQRREAMGRLDALMVEVRGLEREAHDLVQASRNRRHEARQVIVEYNRAVRSQAPPGETRDRHADARLEELLKRGRVTLG